MKTMLLLAMTVASAAMAQTRDLRGAYLYEANLKGVDLRNADLGKTQLGHANLQNADLRGAKLKGAYLHKADLSGADLRGATFSTRLNGAEVATTRLEGAKYDAKTVLPFSRLEAARRGMVQVETVESPELPACNDVPAGDLVASSENGGSSTDTL